MRAHENLLGTSIVQGDHAVFVRTLWRTSRTQEDHRGGCWWVLSITQQEMQRRPAPSIRRNFGLWIRHCKNSKYFLWSSIRAGWMECANVGKRYHGTNKLVM